MVDPVIGGGGGGGSGFGEGAGWDEGAAVLDDAGAFRAGRDVCPRLEGVRRGAGSERGRVG